MDGYKDRKSIYFKNINLFFLPKLYELEVPIGKELQIYFDSLKVYTLYILLLISSKG